MCLAVPAKVIQVQGRLAQVEIGGIVREAALDLLDEARVGDYVLLHAGYAIQRLDKKEARDMLRLIREVADVAPA
jgi:hydrogenase expression/formation protein HypC